MSDVKDELLDLGTAETPEVSSTDEKTPGEKAEGLVSQDVKNSEKTLEEIEWARLKGSTQERVRELIQERDDARRKAELPNLSGQYQQPISQVVPEQSSADFEEAVQKLSQHGMVTRDELRKELGAIQDRMVLEKSHEGLESEYSGSDGRPKYDKVEVEDYMRRKGIWNPLAAYRDLYFDELQDWSIKQIRSKSKTYSEKPTSSVSGREQPLSAESIAERLRKPDGREWYEKNKEKIKPLLGQLTASE